jgi:creatinine amidohydrolase/Fe(II)-dependent formamide hydrolase-like protein
MRNIRSWRIDEEVLVGNHGGNSSVMRSSAALDVDSFQFVKATFLTVFRMKPITYYEQ